MNDALNRRAFVSSGAAFAALLALPAAGLAAAKPRLVSYRSPSCGCCGKWIDAARSAGFDVKVVATDDIYALKAKHGVPDALISCHTSLVGGYVVEGHVPLDAVRRLLRQRPKIRGIAVAGMPLGTPGMEAPDGRKQPFTVMAFDARGRSRPFGS